MNTERKNVEVVYENLPPGIGAKWRYEGEKEWHLEEVPAGAAGILISLRYPERERLLKAGALHTCVSALLNPLHDFGKFFHAVLAELAPLDQFPHDVALVDAAVGIGRKTDPVGNRYVSARRHAEQSLEHLQAALANLDGLMRGENKDRYEEPLHRAVQGAVALLARMDELNQRYQTEECNKPYALRKVRLSGLMVKLDEFLKTFEQAGKLDSQFEPESLARLFGVKNRLKQVKRRLSKLRDNPSQKMAGELGSLAQELDLIHQEVLELMKCTDAWSTRPIDEKKLSWRFEDPIEKPSVTAAKMKHWKTHHTVRSGELVYTDFSSRCEHCWPEDYQAGNIEANFLAAH
ncbi:MAG: hypothetical protein IPK73_00965 [Candidatus Obscuribacter sp.]|nr:hypothetical protein [Candidatus Obscuribacter sp.]MBK9280430.1 hypothetical protein [Candidatus Obscuribacter sp.]